MPDKPLKKWGQTAAYIRNIAAVVLVLLGALWFMLKGPIKEALGITMLEQRVERIDFVAVVVICRSGDYTADEIKRIKTLYRLGKLDVDSLMADWYEK